MKLLVSATSVGSAATDRGVIHQLLIDLGVNSSTAHSAEIYLSAPVRIVVIILVAAVLARLVSRLARRIVQSLRLVSPLIDTTGRSEARIKTLAGAFAQILRAIIWLVAILTILGQFDISLLPFVATATVIGAALGFGAQSLVKDFLSGALLLAEDQFGVGDRVTVGTGTTATVGTVEGVTLRVTRLRGADGGVIYVPNGDIRTLVNDTENDSRALVDVVVPLGTDLVRAGQVLEAAATSVATDPKWSASFTGEPTFAGVQDSSSPTGVTLRVVAPTKPGVHLKVAGEIRLRCLERLRTEGIAWSES
ncbi:MAG: mechanosensitive ion channel family protein [Acidimicrobiales bacterium]